MHSVLNCRGLRARQQRSQRTMINGCVNAARTNLPPEQRAEFYELLRRHQIALVVADNPGQWPIITEIITDLMYVRLHGHDQLYASGYSDQQLDAWAAKITSWTEQGCDVYVYCDNDAKVRAPYDAMGLLARLGLTPSRSERLSAPGHE